MITNGKLIVLLPKTPPALEHKDLSKLQNDGSLRQYFGSSANVTLEETVHYRVKDRINLHTIVVVESGFFADKNEQEIFKKKMEDFGVTSNHVLFGEDYASGYHHIVLKIRELCEY